VRGKNLDEDRSNKCGVCSPIFSARAAHQLDMRSPGLDDREMRRDVQAEVAALWPQVTTENLRSMTDSMLQREFRGLFGLK